MAGVFLLDCPHCPSVNSSYTIVWAEAFREHLAGALNWQVCGTCGGCSRAVVADFSGPQTNPRTEYNGLITLHGAFTLLRAWPVRETPAAPRFTPEASRKRFLSGEFNFQNGQHNPAAAMYRSCLDLSTKALEAPGDTFNKRLKWLFDNGRITADIKDWADHVRVEGNGAIHDEEDISPADSTALRHFTTMFLRYVFEMPGMVAEFRKPAVPSP